MPRSKVKKSQSKNNATTSTNEVLLSRPTPPTDAREDSKLAVLTTCLQYVMSDIIKKWKSFMMGVLAVFLTVSFITFLKGVAALGPLATIKSSMMTSGDFDIMIRGQTEAKPLVFGNNNYYTDKNEFFEAPYLSEADKTRALAE